MPSVSSLLPALAVSSPLARVLQADAGIIALPISNAVIAPDGFARSAVVVGSNGGRSPGPLITGSPTTHFQINVINNLTESSMEKSTSIHWHGLFQKGTNWADGVSMVNQCPIGPGGSFLYDFHANGQAGTFWYHSHHHVQYCDGLRGPLVIYDPYDPHRYLYDVDDENTVITLADWYHIPANQQGPIINSEATLINGLGRMFDNTQPTDLAVVSVTAGKRYRLRIVSISCDPSYTFSIDGHGMTIIEADGVNTVPLNVDSIQIFAGQRYSVVLNANQSVGNYWMRATPDHPDLSATGSFAGGINSAILRYVGAPKSDPITQDTAKNPLIESNLVPLLNPAAPGGADVNAPDVFKLDLNLGFSFPRYTINNVSFQPPSTPVLLQILSGAQSAQSLLPNGSVFSLPRNRVIQISMPATHVGTQIAGGMHPFHLHGHQFSVVRSAGQSNYNFVNPPRRDVVNIGDVNDNVTIRFVTDNAGPWFLHCHIDWHLEAGFAVVLAEDIVDVDAQSSVPQAWSNLCPAYNQLASGDQ